MQDIQQSHRASHQNPKTNAHTLQTNLSVFLRRLGTAKAFLVL